MANSITKRRSNRARVMLGTVSAYDASADLRSAIVDALTDLRHLCDAKGIDFHAAEAVSYQHYLVERRP